jgi:hypothetical protein
MKTETDPVDVVFSSCLEFLAMDEVHKVIDYGKSIGFQNLPFQKEVKKVEVIWQHVFQTV